MKKLTNHFGYLVKYNKSNIFNSISQIIELIKDYHLVVIKDIENGEELTVMYTLYRVND